MVISSTEKLRPRSPSRFVAAETILSVRSMGLFYPNACLPVYKAHLRW